MIGNHKFVPACTGKGYCCPHALMLMKYKPYKDGQGFGQTRLAAWLGIGNRTASYWIQKYRNKELVCTNQTNCFRAVAQYERKQQFIPRPQR